MGDYYNTGRELYKIGNFNQALINFKKARDEELYNLDYLYALGSTYALLYNSEKNFKEALFFYNKILEIDPNHTKALLQKSLLLVNIGKNSEALDLINEGIKKSNDGYLWAMKGRLLSLIHGNDDEVKNCFNKAYELVIDESYVHYLRARAYEHDLKYKKATIYYDKSIEGINDSVCDLDEGIYVSKIFTQLIKGWMYIGSGDYDEALNGLDEALNNNIKSVAVLYAKSYVYYQQGYLEEALDVLKVSLYYDPEDIPSLVLKSCIFTLQGSPKTATRIYQQILDIDPRNGLALMNLSSIYYEEKEFEKALNMAKKALEIERTDGFALYVGSIAARKTGNLRLARKWENDLSNPRVNTIFLERNLQDKIVNEPWHLRKAGYKNLRFIDREFTLKDRSGRLDLLYQNVKTDQLVVIELKVVPATQKAYEQIKNYMDSISKTIGLENEVKGIIISLGHDETFKNLIDNDPDVSQIDYQKLGLV
mgnify:CR=1 FL=1|jgi:tetratricopeptide (TPR) repeat protein